MDLLKAFHGTIIHSVTVTEIELIENGLLVISPTDGKIIVLERNIPRSEIDDTIRKGGLQPSQVAVQQLKFGQFVIPGFIDTHNHAPQWTQRGVGRGIPLLSWLKDVTFAHEARFADPKYARRTYASCVEGFIRQGITTASYYGSLHGEATKILAETCIKKGQRALIGKCNMDSHAVDFYTDASCAESLSVTEDCIHHIRTLDPTNSLVQPILTPRFAISCSPSLLAGLGQMAVQDPSLMIQTHFNEAPDEITFTRQLFPQFTNETDLYAHYNLLGPRTILAHAIFNSGYELQKLAQLNVGIAHCPISNTTIPTFMAAPIRQFLSRGMLKVGLGTDSGGGFSSSILDAMRTAFLVSNARQTYHSRDNAYSQFRAGPPYISAANGHPTSTINETDNAESPLTLEECFYLSTLGGASVCNLDHKVGNFAVGKEFDGLLIDLPGVATEEDSSEQEQEGDEAAKPKVTSTRFGVVASTPVEPDVDVSRTVWEKFLMTGDDRNIAEVWVRGRRIK